MNRSATVFYRWRRRYWTLALASLALVPLACLPEDPATTEDGPPAEVIETPTPPDSADATKTVEDLMDEWHTLAKTPLRSQLGSRHLEIASELASRDPEHLLPILETIGSEEATPEQKVFAVNTVTEQIRTAHLDTLKGIVNTSADGTSRASATHLIGLVHNEEAVKILRTLADDEEKRVRMAAMIGLAHTEDEGDEMRAKLKELYWEEGTNDRDRIAIALLLLESPKDEDAKILEDLIVRPGVDPYTRQGIVYHFGRTAGPTAIPVLERAIEVHGQDAAFEQMARAAIQSIKNRAEEAAN